MTLNNFDIDLFLRDYWQKQPLLIRAAWKSWTNPLDPDELAGLACEEEIESRLIVQKKKNWNVTHGPIPEKRFEKLGKNPWTLLVQAVDRFVPEVAALIDPFRFIPNWRIDDVMVSYASDGGGVGAHFDQYDVFLIQGLGKRRWQIGAMCDETSALLPNDDLRLLAEFEATDEWVLEPGDILYVPPRLSHNGVAVGDDCMTYSVGFRAPARGELIAHWCDDVLGRLNEDDRYEDASLKPQENPGEISLEALAKLQAMITDQFSDTNAFGQWFGEYNSAPKNDELAQSPDHPIQTDELRRQLRRDATVYRNPGSRFTFIRKANNLLLFVDGQSFECSGQTVSLAEQLCAQNEVEISLDAQNSDRAMTLIADIFNQGSLLFAEED